MEAIIPHCAGLDVHNKEVQANIRILDLHTGQLTFNEVRSFSTMTCGLKELAAWLAEQGVTHVAMESTGVFWKPIFNMLDGRFKVLLCNAQHIKNVPGRKTDVKDCQWICHLNQYGLLKGSYVPSTPQRELRDLTRHRAELLNDRTRVVNRLHKILQDANIKLSCVVTDVLGVSGRAMIQALIAGIKDPKALAALAKRKLKRKHAELVKALEGGVSEHHQHMLKVHWEQLEMLERLIREQEQRIAAQMQSERLNAKAVEQQTVAAKAPTAPAQPEKVAPEPAQKKAVPPAYTFPQALEAIIKVTGIAEDSAQAILAETGTDMLQFPGAREISSWTGICPGNRQSAKKRGSGKTNKGNHWLRRVLTQCAWAATRKKDSYFRAQFKRLVGRRGKKRALLAVGHSLLVTIYHMLKYHTEYVDLGPEYLERLHDHRRLRKHIKALEILGYKLIAPPAKAS